MKSMPQGYFFLLFSLKLTFIIFKNILHLVSFKSNSNLIFLF